MSDPEINLRRKMVVLAEHFDQEEDLHNLVKPDSNEHIHFRLRKSFPKTSRLFQVITEVGGKTKPPPYPTFDRPGKAGRSAASAFAKGWSKVHEDFDEPSVTFQDLSGQIYKHTMKILTTDTDTRAKRPFAAELREWSTAVAEKIREVGMNLSEEERGLLEAEAETYRNIFDDAIGTSSARDEPSDEEKAEFIAAVNATVASV